MKLLAALKYVVELLTQLISLGEEGLSKLVQRMNYVKEITQCDNLPSIKDFRQYLNSTVKQIVNCDKPPHIPTRYEWSLREEDQPDNSLTGEVSIERRGNNLYINGNKVLLHRTREQRGNKGAFGSELYMELKNSKKVLLPAHILDYLVAHSELIPDNWKGKDVFFWGTIYRHSDGDLYVRYLRWNDGRWRWYCDWLDIDWYSRSPAAVLASKN